MDLEQKRIVREELWRSIGWAGLGIVGWPALVTEVAWLEQNLFTVFGLPVVTWAVLTGVMIGIRTVTNAELQVQPPTGVSVSFLLGFLLGGVGAVYLVFAGGYSILLVSAGYLFAHVAVGAATVVWYWYAGVLDKTSWKIGA